MKDEKDDKCDIKIESNDGGCGCLVLIFILFLAIKFSPWWLLLLLLFA